MRGARRALLALCISLAASLALPAAATAVTQTFSFTGTSQTFTVPTGVTQITVEVLGAQGGLAQDGTAGGLGGRGTATIAVTPGEVLQVNVGGQGGTGNPAAGGFNGGGAGGTGSSANSGGGGGGGASDVRRGGTGLAARIVIAGGGGGGGNIQGQCAGGSGGGTAGGDGSPCSGTQQGRGGTQIAGGAGGTVGEGGGNPGVTGTGGDGGDSGPGHSGGGGGGGLFGGGGGAGGIQSVFDGGGGGGGSGFTPDGSGMTNGVRAGNGQVAITYTVTPTLTTNASGNVTIGGQVNDTATLADGASPTGQITFRLYGPDDSDCLGTPVFTDTQTVSGNGAYQSASFTPTAAGIYRWTASYSGDADNNAVAGACNDPNESVTVEAITPVFRTSLVAGVVRGTVLIRERGSSEFRKLTGSESIPLGSSVETTNGRVGITAATKEGGTQRTEFYKGRFNVDQAGSGLVKAKLKGAKFGSCKGRSQIARRAPKKLARLWGSGRGRARTRGRRGSGTVRGTIWLTEERCDGTFFKVKKGKLKVRDFGRKKNVTLRAGDSYLARDR